MWVDKQKNGIISKYDDLDQLRFTRSASSRYSWFDWCMSLALSKKQFKTENAGDVMAKIFRFLYAQSIRLKFRIILWHKKRKVSLIFDLCDL